MDVTRGVAMRQELLEKLSEITPEEQEILDGQTEVHQELYSTGRDFVIDSRLLLEKGRLIEIRPHTRFVYFPSHRHNYVELVYMVSGSMTHIIGGKTRITLQEGDLLFLKLPDFVLNDFLRQPELGNAVGQHAS